MGSNSGVVRIVCLNKQTLVGISDLSSSIWNKQLFSEIIVAEIAGTLTTSNFSAESIERI